MKAKELRFTVNGDAVLRQDVPDHERLLDTLRWRLGLKGTKEGCRTGDCGACTVLVGDRPVLSCLTLTQELAGSSITTVEGIGDDPLGRRVQSAFEKESALQCGYCTPGFVLAMTASMKAHGDALDEATLADDLGGNLCRCTGYAAIRRAGRTLLEQRK